MSLRSSTMMPARLNLFGDGGALGQLYYLAGMV